MPGGAAARLVERAEDRVAGSVDVDDRHQFLHPLRRDPFGLHALQGVGVNRAQVAPHLVMGLAQHQEAAGGEHDVVVQVLAQRLIEAAGLFVDRGRGVLQVVRTDDGGVPPGVAAAEPALLDHRDIGDAVVLAEVVGGGEAVSPCPHDDRVVGGLGFRRGPGAFPTHVVAECFAGDGKDRIALHRGLMSDGMRRESPARISWNGSGL